MPSKRLSDPGICPMIGLAGWQNGWIYKSILNKTIYFIKTDLYYLCGKISLFLFYFFLNVFLSLVTHSFKHTDTFILHCYSFPLFHPLLSCLSCISPLWHTHTESLTFLPFSLSLYSLPLPLPSLSLLPFPPFLILMHGCIFGLCWDTLTPGGCSWNQFGWPVPSHWSTIYRPSTAEAAGRLFNWYIMCLTWQSIYSRFSPSFKHKEDYLWH